MKIVVEYTYSAVSIGSDRGGVAVRRLQGDQVVRQDNGGYWQIVLQNSFCTGVQKFCGLQARLSCKDARDLIASRKTHRRLR
jgi:hypothetical protein